MSKWSNIHGYAAHLYEHIHSIFNSNHHQDNVTKLRRRFMFNLIPSTSGASSLNLSFQIQYHNRYLILNMVQKYKDQMIQSLWTALVAFVAIVHSYLFSSYQLSSVSDFSSYIAWHIIKYINPHILRTELTDNMS